MTIALALLFAAAEFGAPVVQENPQAPVPMSALVSTEKIITVKADDGTEIPAHTSIIVPTMTFSVDSDGWVTYADGSVKCVNAAPCQEIVGYDGSAYTYNFNDGTYYAASVTAE